MTCDIHNNMANIISVVLKVLKVMTAILKRNKKTTKPTKGSPEPESLTWFYMHCLGSRYLLSSCTCMFQLESCNMLKPYFNFLYSLMYNFISH